MADRRSGVRLPSGRVAAAAALPAPQASAGAALVAALGQVLSVAATSENGGSEDGSITVYHAQHQMEFECVWCEECTSIAKSQPVNKEKPFDKCKCNLCSSVDRRMQRQNIIEAFKKKPHEQKVAYYKE